MISVIDTAPFEGPPLCGSHNRDLSWSLEPPLPPVPPEAIVLGDFNCTPDSPSYAVLAGEASARHGRLTRLGRFVDFCFLPDRFASRVRMARVLPDAVGSDHLPVIVEIES